MTRQLTLDEHLAVPYILDVASIQDETGDWCCQFAYDELPDCVVRDDNPIDALDALERLRVRIIVELVASGVSVPVPRPPTDLGVAFELPRGS